MDKSNYIHKPVLKLINTVLMCAPLFVCWFVYYESRTMTVHSKQSSVLFLASYVILFYVTCTRLDGFKLTIHRIGELVFSQVLAAGFSDALAGIMIWMLSVHFPNLWPGILCFLAQIVISVITVLILRRYYFAHHKPLKAIVIYDVRRGMKSLIQTHGLDIRFAVHDTYPVEDVLKNLSILDDNEVVLMCGVHSSERNVILKACVEKNIAVYMIPRVGDVMISGAERMHMLHLPILRVKRYAPASEFRIIKRSFDFIVSGLFLVLLSPLFLIVSLIIRKDGGPAFYKQTRLTKDGKEFQIIKFRSMRVDAEKYSGAVLSAGENDPRITKVGRIIRACRLDELPQLINIFKGEMSFVGPRPERPEIAEEYERDLPEFRLRLQAKAGLTGYAQVYGKYNTTPYDKLLMDLMYIAHPSVFEDTLIILSTLKILFVKDSTEGIAAGATNAEDDSYHPDRRQDSV